MSKVGIKSPKVTFTLHFATALPYVALITVAPTSFAVNCPFSSTDTTDGSSDDHLSTCSSPPVNSALNSSESPSTRDREVLFILTVSSPDGNVGSSLHDANPKHNATIERIVTILNNDFLIFSPPALRVRHVEQRRVAIFAGRADVSRIHRRTEQVFYIIILQGRKLVDVKFQNNI